MIDYLQIIAPFILSLVIGAFAIPLLKKYKLKQTERKERPESHLKKNGTPTMGGLIFIASFLICVIGFSIYYLTHKSYNPLSEFIPLILTAIGFALVGLADDIKKAHTKKGISAKSKMIALAVIGSLFLIYKYFIIGSDPIIYLPFSDKAYIMDKYLFFVFSLFVLLATTNAFNLTDGVDGLCSMITIIVLVGLTLIAQKYLTDLSILTKMLIGALVGFLTYNLYPAKVFMGDTGSLFLGGFVALVAIYMGYPLILIMLCIMPIIETLSVMIQVTYFKITNGKRIFKMTPIHHHFELKGWSETKIVVIFSIITILAMLLTLYSVDVKMFV